MARSPSEDFMRPSCAVELAAVVALAAMSAIAPGYRPSAALPDLVELRPGAFHYRASGDFTRDGKPVRAPLATATIPRTLAVMRHQVTEADYRRCVDAGECVTVDGDAADRPVVKVSWRDAHAYASWLSHQTGTHFRLPTDEEWTFAAGSRFQDDALPDSAYDGDPGRRALALYEVAADRRAATDKEPQPIGTFGANEHGLVDLAGNVWEWTDSCFVRAVIETSGAVRPTTVDCGVRVVAGRHRAYMPDFIRDARTGGCSAGALPSNLGFRLVRDDRWPALRSFL
jgi:formylglycine-generating enzyme required for sulfatase activity